MGLKVSTVSLLNISSALIFQLCHPYILSLGTVNVVIKAVIHI